MMVSVQEKEENLDHMGTQRDMKLTPIKWINNSQDFLICMFPWYHLKLSPSHQHCNLQNKNLSDIAKQQKITCIYTVAGKMKTSKSPGKDEMKVEHGCKPGRLLLTFQTVDRYLDAFSIQTLAYTMVLVSQTFIMLQHKPSQNQI